MTSVERVVEYTELESEAPWETQKRPPPDWPNKGLVTFDQVSFSYIDDGPLVLHNLKAMFRPKEKVRHVCHQMTRYCWFAMMSNLSGRSIVFLCARLVLWGERVLGKAPLSQLCSAWQSLREKSTSMAF